MALGVAFAGYHLWKHRKRCSLVEVEHSYLLNLPAELRLMIYDFVFDEPDEEQSPSQFLLPLLTCRLIYQEAYPRAFRRANFVLRVPISKAPFWTPQTLTLPACKLQHVRRIHVLWDSSLLEIPDLRRFFYELEHGPLHLSELVFIVRNPHSLAPFRFKYATLFPGVRDFGKYVMEELPVMDNVKRVVFPSPAIEAKRTFQHLFDPRKPRITVDDAFGVPSVSTVNKKLGGWKYTVVRDGRDVKDWRLELMYPEAKADLSGKEEEEAVER